MATELCADCGPRTCAKHAALSGPSWQPVSRADIPDGARVREIREIRAWHPSQAYFNDECTVTVEVWTEGTPND